MLTIPNITIGR